MPGSAAVHVLCMVSYRVPKHSCLSLKESWDYRLILLRLVLCFLFYEQFENILCSVFFLPLSIMVHCERTDDIYIHTHIGGRIFPNVVLKCWSTFPKFGSKGNCCGFRSWHLAELNAASWPFSSWRKCWQCLTSLSTSKPGRGDPRVLHVPSGMLRLRSQE